MTSFATTYKDRTANRYAIAIERYRRLIFDTAGNPEAIDANAIDAAIMAVNQAAGSVTGEIEDSDVERLLENRGEAPIEPDEEERQKRAAAFNAATASDAKKQRKPTTIAVGDVDTHVEAVGAYLAARQIVDSDVEVVRLAREAVTRARQALEQAIAPFHERVREVRARVEHANHLARNWKPWEGNSKPDSDQTCNNLRWEEKTIAATLELHRIPYDRAIEESELSLSKAEHRYYEAERKTIEIRNAHPWILKLSQEQRLARPEGGHQKLATFLSEHRDEIKAAIAAPAA